ncbi:MAG TPA: CPBP family intramembrane glutamic endopeptidase [Limnochordales bacterium]|nr:CPBP family intramembrane glutamic endopeptidase [Limnochordales bacterium]
MAVYLLAMVLVPWLAAGVLRAAVPDAGMPGPVREAALTGGVLLVQGVALIGFTVGHVLGPRGLGLPPAALGLSPVEWRAGAGLGLVGGLGLVLINVLGSRAAVAAFRVLLGEEGLARQLARERAAITDLFQLDLPLPVLLLLLLASVVMAPVSEEIFFRGYVHGVLRARLGAGAAYVSAAAFAAAHMYLVHFLPLFLMGILLARLYERGGTLVAPVLAHAVVNLVVALSLRL